MVKLVLLGKKLLEMSKTNNAHQLSLKARSGYPTVEKYVNRPEAIVQLDMGVMGQILTEGLNLTPEQAKDLRLGDIFDIVEVQVGQD